MIAAKSTFAPDHANSGLCNGLNTAMSVVRAERMGPTGIGVAGLEDGRQPRDAAFDHLLVDDVGLVQADLRTGDVARAVAVGVVDLHDERRTLEDRRGRSPADP